MPRSDRTIRLRRTFATSAIQSESYANPFVTRNRAAFGNVIYRPRSDLLLSLEYRRLRTFSIYDQSYGSGAVEHGDGDTLLTRFMIAAKKLVSAGCGRAVLLRDRKLVGSGRQCHRSRGSGGSCAHFSREFDSRVAHSNRRGRERRYSCPSDACRAAAEEQDVRASSAGRHQGVDGRFSQPRSLVPQCVFAVQRQALRPWTLRSRHDAHRPLRSRGDFVHLLQHPSRDERGGRRSPQPVLCNSRQAGRILHFLGAGRDVTRSTYGTKTLCRRRCRRYRAPWKSARRLMPWARFAYR